jgi:hypothetical protein
VTIAKQKFKRLTISDGQNAGMGFSDYENEIYEHYSKALHEYSLSQNDIEVMLFRAEKRLY